MIKNILFALIAIALTLGGCGGGGSGDRAGGGQAASTDGEQAAAKVSAIDNAELEEAYKTLDEKLDTEISDAEKAGLARAFLEKYPESSHTSGLCDGIVWWQGHKGEDMPGAVGFVENIRGRVTGEEIALDLDRRLISWYGQAGMKESMTAIARRFEEEGVARFGDYFDVIESAVAMEEWAMVRAWCRKAAPKATVETWRAEWPDQEATDEQAEKAGKNRRAMLAVNDSWARANLGEAGEALGGFEEAASVIDVNYVGVHGYSLDLYWGKTLLMKGDPEMAIEKFAPGGLIVHAEEEIAGLKSAFATLNGSSSGYDAWAKRYRDSIAKAYDDFELPDRGGERRRMSDLRGKVTLLNFWSPT